MSTPYLTAGQRASVPETVPGPSAFQGSGELTASIKLASEGTRSRSGVLGAAWTELLNRYEWAWLFTATFREAIHPEAADKKFRFWVSQLAESYLGGNWRRSPSKFARSPQWVRGLEWQKRDVLHYHALITAIPREYVEWSHRKLWCDRWAELKNAGFAWCDACTGSQALYSYVTKYVAKGGEIDFSPTLRREAQRLQLVSV